jgi:hypothetical protein
MMIRRMMREHVAQHRAGTAGVVEQVTQRNAAELCAVGQRFCGRTVAVPLCKCREHCQRQRRP